MVGDRDRLDSRADEARQVRCPVAEHDSFSSAGSAGSRFGPANHPAGTSAILPALHHLHPHVHPSNAALERRLLLLRLPVLTLGELQDVLGYSSAASVRSWLAEHEAAGRTVHQPARGRYSGRDVRAALRVGDEGSYHV